jgi:hypothetical protein
MGVLVMDAPNNSFHIKLAERVFWTAVQAGLAAFTVEQLDLPVPGALIPVIASLLSIVKGYVARRVGNSNDPATLPHGV